MRIRTEREPIRVSTRNTAKPAPMATIEAMNSNATSVPKCAGQARSEQQDHHRADHQRRQHRQENRLADQGHAAVEHAELGDQPVVLAAAAGEDARLEFAGAIDDPGEPAGADVEECTDSGEQEHRRDGQLDDLRDLQHAGFRG